MAKRPTRSARRKPASRSAKSGGSLLPWLGCGLAAAAAIWFYDNSAKATRFSPAQMFSARNSASETQEQVRKAAETTPARPAPSPSRETLLSSVRPPEAIPVAVIRPAVPAPALSTMSEPQTPPDLGRSVEGAASFGYCGQGEHINCVADGASFWYRGAKITMADIASPGVESARCEAERRAGFTAKARLLQLLNAGRFSLTAQGSAHLVSRSGRSLGQILLSEGLARRPGSAGTWCL